MHKMGTQNNFFIPRLRCLILARELSICSTDLGTCMLRIALSSAFLFSLSGFETADMDMRGTEQRAFCEQTWMAADAQAF
jgi:hypothetical protein